MRWLVIGMVIILTLSLAPDAGLATEAEAAEEGLTVLNRRPFKLGWGSIFDFVSSGKRLVAVGYDATYEESWSGAWTSTNGRKWGRTHGLSDYTFTHALPLAHGAVLAFRGDGDGCHVRAGVSVVYSAANLAHYLMEMGRLDEALAYAQEAAASEVVHGVRPAAIIHEAWIRDLRGETDDIERARTVSGAAEILTEPQLRIDVLLARTVARWPRDREGALAELAAALDERDRRHGVVWLDMVHEAARMALRLRDRRRLQDTIALHQRSRWPGGPAIDARCRWIDGLVGDDGGAAVEEAAVELFRVDYVRKAVDAWTDAALLAARAGRPSDAAKRARSIMAATGIHPLLGPPE